MSYAARRLDWQLLVSRLCGVMAGAVATALLFAAAALVSRRLAGGLAEAISPRALLGVALVAAFLTSVSRRLVELSRRAMPQPALDRWTMGASAVALIGGVAALGQSASATAIAVIAAATVALDLGLELWLYARVGRKSLRPKVTPVVQIVGRAADLAETEGDDERGIAMLPAPGGVIALESPPGADVLQQLVRSQTAEVDMLRGWLQTPLGAADRNVTLHVSFCPAFDTPPKVTIRQVSGPDSRVKPVQILPLGMRLELKRTAIAKAPGTVIIQFLAEAPRRGAGGE